LEHPGVDWRITFRWIFRKWYGGTDWIYLAKEREKSQAFVKAVKNLLQIPYAGNFLTS
jgi:hypothetical protein